jgi:hypothetical protein
MTASITSSSSTRLDCAAFCVSTLTRKRPTNTVFP